MTGPLEDVKILDLTEYITGPYATKMFADYGADVLKVERPRGDPARQLGPFPDDTPHPERSGTFFYFNTNKRSIVLDLGHPRGREVLGSLVDRADLVVESFRPGALDQLGVGWDWIRERRADLPLVSISNFGQDGPYRDYKGSELVLFGFGGEMYTMGLPDRAPVKMYGTAALVQSGAAASVAMMAAMMAGREQGIGQHVDFSIFDSQMGSADRRHANLVAWEYAGKRVLRSGALTAGMAHGAHRCVDGWVEFTAAGQRRDRLSNMLGNPDWFEDPKWKAPAAAFDPALVDEFNDRFSAWLATRTKREVFAQAREAKVLCGPLFTVRELFEDEHFRERSFWETVEHAELGTFEMPGRPFVMSASPWELRRPAPLLGEHTREVLGEAGWNNARVEELVVENVVYEAKS